MITTIISGLMLAFLPLAVVGLVIHIRVLMHAKPGVLGLLKKAMVRHNWDVAATLLEPQGVVELGRLRMLIDWMYRVGGLAFLVIVIVGLFWGNPQV